MLRRYPVSIVDEKKKSFEVDKLQAWLMTLYSRYSSKSIDDIR